jgi:hypothetical protein
VRGGESSHFCQEWKTYRPDARADREIQPKRRAALRLRERRDRPANRRAEDRTSEDHAAKIPHHE